MNPRKRRWIVQLMLSLHGWSHCLRYFTAAPWDDPEPVVTSLLDPEWRHPKSKRKNSQ